MALEGLTAVSSESLRVLLRHVHRGEVTVPLTIAELTRTGLQHCAIELLGHLRTLDRAGVVAVLTAVLAEREASARRSPAFDVRVETSVSGHDGGDDNAFSGGSDVGSGAVPVRIVLASRNAHKIEELSRMAPEVEWLLLPDSAGDPPETGSTFEANALQKARFGAAATGLPCLADDSGIEVDALGGRPGVWSKRYSPEATDAANNALLLRELSEVGALAPEARTARYRCVIALVTPRGTEQVFDGRCEGTIGYAPRGSNGFGYDPLFLPTAAPGRAMAELQPSDKDAISHRGAALQAFKQAGVRLP